MLQVENAKDTTHASAAVAVSPAGEEDGGVALMSFLDLLVGFFLPPTPSQDQSLPIFFSV